MSPRKILLGLLLAPVVMFAGWNLVERVHTLAAVPDGTGAFFVTYADNNTFGFGPGGNETGFNVILLTSGGAERVATGGADWLNEQSGAKLWAATPVPVDEFWAGRIGSANGRQPAPSIDAVLNRYGFGLDLPDHHRAAVNAALNARGGYWGGSGDGRLILIVPKTRRAYVFYAD